jgi:ABC-type multidrug transport system fused ATPase/permease subunit
MLSACIVGSWILCFVLDWEFALVIIPFGALSLFSGWVQVRSNTKVEKIHGRHQDAMSDHINEVMDQIPTIVVLGQEDEVVRRLESPRPSDGANLWLIGKQAGHALGETSSAATAAMVYW